MEVTIILDPFYISGSTTEVVRVSDLAIWIKVLEGISAQELRAAWVFHMQNDPPRNKAGYLLKPDPAILYRRVIQLRERAAILAPRPPSHQIEAPRRDAVASAEARARIMRDVYRDRLVDGGVAYTPRPFPQPQRTPASHLKPTDPEGQA